jgi:3-phenylpropionate/trans-cinnamate dioxygenase ferredoxin component
MTGFVDICAAPDVPNGKHRKFSVDGKSILIFRMGDDFYALENRCTHLNMELEGGRQIGCEIICRQHGARFDIRTGKAIGGPAVDPAKTFPLRIIDGRVEIQI